MTTLQPCPFCGSKDIEVEREGTNRQSCIISCADCGCRLESNEIGSGQQWNERVMTINCKDCKWTELYRGMLCCVNPKIHEGTPGDDELSYSYEEGGDFHVGPSFGCIHGEKSL